jgi:CRP-like cAMP-binding protein
LNAGEDTAIRVRSHYQREFAPGQLVVGAGEPADHLFVIQSGEIELSREGPVGHRGVARLGPGDFFGELGVVLGERVPTRAVAVKATRVLQLDRETLESMCLAQPEIAIRMIRVLVSRLIEAERRLAALGVEDLLRPMVRSLVRQARPAEEAGKGARISTSLQLADDPGFRLEAHARYQLFDRKLIQLVDDCLVVPDLRTLRLPGRAGRLTFAKASDSVPLCPTGGGGGECDAARRRIACIAWAAPAAQAQASQDRL